MLDYCYSTNFSMLKVFIFYSLYNFIPHCLWFFFFLFFLALHLLSFSQAHLNFCHNLYHILLLPVSLFSDILNCPPIIFLKKKSLGDMHHSIFYVINHQFNEGWSSIHVTCGNCALQTQVLPLHQLFSIRAISPFSKKNPVLPTLSRK